MFCYRIELFFGLLYKVKKKLQLQLVRRVEQHATPLPGAKFSRGLIAYDFENDRRPQRRRLERIGRGGQFDS